MKLLLRNNHAVLIIGLGLVGSAIYSEIKKRYSEIATAKINWSSLADSKAAFAKIIQDHLPRDVSKIDVIWSAGKTGFLATSDEIKTDLLFFKRVNDEIGAILLKLAPDASRRYVLISSAGGLYEGQTNVGLSSPPVTKRPYGDLKLEQENYVRDARWIDQHAILRLSSVYTVSNLSSRLGLIPTIVSRAIRQEFVTIFGTEMTLRDYVLDRDIGKYVADHIDKDMPEEGFIIDGKPYSILEIKGMIEQITGKKVYLRYTLLKSNAANISFSPNIRAANYSPSNLKTNLKILYDNLSAGNQI